MRCWGVCGRLCGGTVLLLKFQNSNAEDDAGRLGRAPSLPAVLSSALRLEVSGYGEMSEVRAAQRGGLKGEGQKQDKSRASQVTPGRSQRPAVRAAFRAFAGRDRDSGNCLENLAGICFWGHFRGKNYALASAFPESLLSQRFEAGSIVAPGRFWHKSQHKKGFAASFKICGAENKERVNGRKV